VAGQTFFVGDVHGKLREFKALLTHPSLGDEFVQVGDMGYGFSEIPVVYSNVHILRGNHDSPAVASGHPNYIGNYGVKTVGREIFYASGAWSIDRQQRVEGRSWWRDEELSYPELDDAVVLFEQTKPDVVVSHDCPESITVKILDRLTIGHDLPATGLDGGAYRSIPNKQLFRTRTGQALQHMLDKHQPKLWVFGHYHIYWRAKIGNTYFVCLPELGVASLEQLLEERESI
jgi:predicted phosphodiesterase